MTEIIEIQEQNSEETILTTNPETGQLEELDIHTGEPVLYMKKDTIPYSLNKAREFCSYVREGDTFLKASFRMGLSYSIISYWRSRHPDFDEAVAFARQERAEFFHDKVLRVADELEEKDDVPVAKTKIDAYKWAAEKNDPTKFGNKKDSDGVGSVTIIVDTGIGNGPTTIELNTQGAGDERELKGQSTRTKRVYSAEAIGEESGAEGHSELKGSTESGRQEEGSGSTKVPRASGSSTEEQEEKIQKENIKEKIRHIPVTVGQ